MSKPSTTYRTRNKILLCGYWIGYLIYCINLRITQSSISSLPVAFFAFSVIMMIKADTKYRKAYESQVENPRTVDFLRHKWTNNPCVNAYNKIFFIWLATFALSVIIFWVAFAIQYAKLPPFRN